MSKTFDELQAQHIKLLDEYSTSQNIKGLLNEVQVYIDQVKIASQKVSNSRERSQLRANLRFWGGHVFEATGKYPSMELAPALKQEQTKPLSLHSALLLVTIVIVAGISGIYGLFFRTSPPEITTTVTPENVEGLIVKTSINCSYDADGLIQAEIIVKPLNGTPPYIIPGYNFTDSLSFVVHQGDVLQLIIQSSDQPPLTWLGKVMVDCPTKNSSPTLQFSPSEITDGNGIAMVLVPAGEFEMGSDSSFNDAKNVHAVFLDSYYVDKYEVTNEFYRKCIDAGACEIPLATTSNERTDYFYKPQFDNYPVIYVSWDMAKTYCEWRGARLPTEAEWEKSARGTDNRIYPWGNYPPNDTLLNSDNVIGDTSSVGSFSKGVSPYGAYDMAGNVSEWTSDWYDAEYYLFSPRVNPLGPQNGEFRVVRGGSWKSIPNDVRSTARSAATPFLATSAIGFRCAVSIP